MTMTIDHKSSFRTLLAAAGVALSASALVFSDAAQAQTKTALRVTTFSPVLAAPNWTDPPNPDIPVVQQILIGLLLPAVQPSWTPFKVEAIAGDGRSAVLANPPTPDRTMAFFDVFLEDLGGGSLRLHLRNEQTREEQTVDTTSHGIVVRVLPAAQTNGTLVQPLSAGETLRGLAFATMPDGGLLKMPFQYSPQTSPTPQ
jgi:hypothetical protein